MKIGEQVEVTWIEEQQGTAAGKIYLASDDGTSIAVLFANCPPFAFIGESASMTVQGYLLLLRQKPDGSWEDVAGGRRFQVQRLEVDGFAEAA